MKKVTKPRVKNLLVRFRQWADRRAVLKHAERWFVMLCGTALLWLGLNTVAEAVSNASVYNLADPTFGCRLRVVLCALGALEVVVGLVCLLSGRTQLSLLLVAWLAANACVYRGGLQWMGWRHPYHWLSSVVEQLPLSAPVADLVLIVLFGCILVGSSLLLIFHRKTSEGVVYYKIRCPNCGGKIEFPRHALGLQVPCPHCSKTMSLELPVPNPVDVAPQAGRGGFTLIELLVVIAIMGILASLLMPTLNKAKDRAYRVTDINNLKQQITATHLYTADHNDILPWPNWAIGDRPDRRGWLYTLDPNATGPVRFKVETGVFWPVLRNPKLYFCPRDGPHVPRFNERPQQISSYVMNGAVIGYNRTNYPPERLSSFRPDDILFWETDERYPDYFNDGASYPKEGVSKRHELGAIHATFGGQVGYIKIDAWYLEEASPNRNRLWCYPRSPDGR